MKRIQKILGGPIGRILLNLLVWYSLLETTFSNYKNDVAGHTPKDYWLHVGIMHLLFWIMIYTNTLVLMPRLLLRKKRILYFAAFLPFLLAFTFIIGNYSEWLIHHYPGLHKYDFISISIVSKSETTTLFNFYSNVFTDSFIIVFVFSLGYFMQRYFKERKRMEELEKKQLESEIMMLRSQINPHFLFNVLNSIYALSLKKSDQTPEVVLKLSDMLRYMLYETSDQLVPLHKEVEMLTNYLDIEKVRLSRKESIQFNVEGPLHNWHIAPSILQPFIENAIKHGLDSNATDGFMHVNINAHNGRLSFECRNNFKLRPEGMRINNIGGIGLDNVRKRLQLIYGDKHQLEIKNNGSLYDVSLQLQMSQL